MPNSGMTEAGNGGFLLPRVVVTSVRQQCSGASSSKRCHFRCPHRSCASAAGSAQPKCRGLIWTLLHMGVADNPGCALRKQITHSDIDRGQHRLLLSKDALDRPLLEATMTAAERARTTENNGLKVQVLDRLGREYALVLKFLKSIQTYRIMGPDYNRLITDNGFQVGDYIDLWLFRARRGRGEANEVPEAGEFMMAILHYDTDGTKNHVLVEEEEKEEVAEPPERMSLDDEEEEEVAEPPERMSLDDEEEEEVAEPPERMSLDEEDDEVTLAALTMMKLNREALAFPRFDAGGA